MLVVAGGNFTNIVFGLPLASSPDLGQVILKELRSSFFLWVEGLWNLLEMTHLKPLYIVWEPQSINKC